MVAPRKEKNALCFTMPKLNSKSVAAAVVVKRKILKANIELRGINMIFDLEMFANY